MKLQRQAGYTDLQIMPTIMGVILVIIVIGLTDNPAFDPAQSPVKFYSFLLLALAVLLFGFGMHLYALEYPESPFNKHSSPVFMTLMCAGSMGYGSWRLLNAGMQGGGLLLAVLTVSVCVMSIGFAHYRNRRKGDVE